MSACFLRLRGSWPPWLLTVACPVGSLGGLGLSLRFVFIVCSLCVYALVRVFNPYACLYVTCGFGVF